jgi:hypothetical protein
MIRILLAKPAIDEGEGIFLLLKILSLQADMYKTMGLFPLALSLYLDIADITASLLGFSEYVTFKAFGLVMLCYKKMGKSYQSDSYLKFITDKLATELKKNEKLIVIDKLNQLNKNINKEFLKLNNLYKEHVYPLVRKYNSGCISRRYHELLGIGGFYQFLNSEESVFVMARKLFFLFCNSEDCPHFEIVAPFAHFVDVSFRMRITDEEDVYRLLVQYILQKCLSKALVETSPLAKLFREITSADSIQSIVSFIHQGSPLDIRVFDEILYFSLLLLAPIYRYFLFLSVMGSSIIQEHSVELMAEGMDIAAILIQCFFRKWKGKKTVQEKKRAIEETERKEKEVKQAKEQEKILLKEKFVAESMMTGMQSNSRASNKMRR